MRDALFIDGDNVQATDPATAVVYDGIVRYRVPLASGWVYGVEVQEVERVLQFPESALRKAPERAKGRRG